jgi:hypothetical protein
VATVADDRPTIVVTMECGHQTRQLAGKLKGKFAFCLICDCIRPVVRRG